jgi:hypothetical protein
LTLFIAEKRFKEAFYSVSLAIALTLLSFLFYEGTFWNNWARYLENLNTYNRIYALDSAGLAFGHSLFGFLKVALGFFPLAENQTISTIPFLMKIYFPIALFLFLLTSIYIILFKDEIWKKVALLVFAMNLLPYVSADYKLLHIFLPLFLFVNHPQENLYGILYALIFSSLLIPKDYYHFGGSEVSLSVILNPLIMLGGAILIITTRILAWRKLVGCHEIE